MPTCRRRCSTGLSWIGCEFGKNIVTRRAGCDFHPAVIVESVRSGYDRTLQLSLGVEFEPDDRGFSRVGGDHPGAPGGGAEVPSQA